MSPGWSLPTLIRTAQGGGQGLALRGEGSPGPGKYLGPQRTDVWVIEKRTVIEQAIIFIVSSHTQEAFTTAGGVKGLGAAVCDVSASKQKLGTFPAVNHGGAPTSLCRGIGDLKVDLSCIGARLSNSHYHYRSADFRAHLDEWRGVFLYLREAM